MRVVVVLSLLIFSGLAKAQTCQPLNDVTRYLRFLKSYQSSKYAWPGFSLAKNIHVIADLQTLDHCAFVIENGKVSQVIETQDRVTQSKLSDEQVEKMIPAGVTQEQHDKLKKRFLSSALTPDWNVIPATETNVGSIKWATELNSLVQSKGLRSLYYVGIHDLANRLEDVVGLAHHEAFHHFFQHEAGQWPKWDRQPTRGSMRDLCYKKTPEIFQLYKSEKGAVINALSAQFKNDKAERSKQVALFSSTRIQRYQKLRDLGVTVARGSLENVSCDEAESIMEISEGIAFFVEATANLAIGNWKSTDVISNFQQMPDLEPFYVLGAAQTFLLTKKVGLKRLQKELSASTTWKSGLFSYFNSSH